MFQNFSFFHKKTVETNRTEVLNLHTEELINKLIKYNIFDFFSSKTEVEKWILELNLLEMNNLLNLDIEPENIKFSPNLLINKNLLNTIDYNKKVKALASIENADGWYHLFDRMLNPEFLYSDKFYQDIETMKKAKSAQMSLWIIGEESFINSPYHDEDFELLVTSKDTSGKDCDFLVWDAIATVAENYDSIKSNYHRQDLQTIINYSGASLQGSHSYPEGSINNLAINPISLNDIYHLENMELLANNKEIGNFLYAVMTNSDVIKRRDYRNIINEMVENKENKSYVFLVCYYAIGEKAVAAQNICLHDYFYEIKSDYNIEELLQKVDERIHVIDGQFKEVSTYELECNEPTKIKRIAFKKVLKKIKNKENGN